MARKTQMVRAAPKPQMPVEALDLADDEFRLDLVIQLLEHVNPDHIATVESLGDRQDCCNDLRLAISNLKRWRRYAWNRMRKDFLAR
jgi:hypothetical protein